MTDEEKAAILDKAEGFCWKAAWQMAGRFGLDFVEEVAAYLRVRLCQAANGFRPELGFTFGTYVYESIFSWAKWYRDHELARGMRFARNVQTGRIHRPHDLDMPLDQSGESDATLAEMVADPRREPDPDREEFWALVNKFINPRYRDLIRMRFREGLTLGECGQIMGVTRQRVRQMEENALTHIAQRCPELADWLPG